MKSTAAAVFIVGVSLILTCFLYKPPCFDRKSFPVEGSLLSER